MKLIGMDPRVANRQELATRGRLSGGDEWVGLNVRLHNAVLERIRTGK